MKILINSSYGGYGVSDDATKEYLSEYVKRNKLEWKLITFNGSFGKKCFFIVKQDFYMDNKNAEYYWDLSSDTSKCMSADTLINDSIESRTDPLLIEIFEKMKDDFSGDFARICEVDIPSGSQYRITEYDGMESIEYQNDDYWHIAT